MSQFTFVTNTSATVSDGFDIDNRVSTMSDPMTCGIDDFTSPSGTPGIDNQFSALVAAINLATNNVLQTDIHNAINNGQLLISVSVQHVDDPMNDPCVDVVFRKVHGTALVGTDGFLNPNQTFDVVATAPVSTVHASLVNGVIDVAPFTLALPVNILDADFVINLHNAHLRLTLAADGSMTGLMGGGIEVSEISTIASGLTIGTDLRDQAVSLAQANADLVFDGSTCAQISAAFSFNAVPAFVN